MKKDKPRILFVGTLPPPIHGSAVVSQQIKDSKVINDAFEGDWVNLSTSRTMDEIGKKTFAKPFRFLNALLKEFWLLLTHRYDLCYLAITCRGRGFLKDSPFILMCKSFHRKVVIHQHNKGMANDIYKWPYRWLLPHCYKNAKVILLSWHLYPDIEKVVRKEDVFICPNGIKVQEFKNSRVLANASEQIRAQSQELENSRVSTSNTNCTNDVNKIPRLLFLSNLIESKGVLVLLDALKLLNDKGYSFICDFVGGETKEIDTKRFNEEVEDRGLNEIAIYHGRKYGEEKNTMFRETDVFVLPTLNDCFPLVILEAMEHGKPIVTTNIGGIPDIVDDGKTGLIAKTGDSHSLSDCLEKLIVDGALCKQMGEAGRKKLVKEFTEEVFEKRIKELLWTMINS